MANSEEEEEVWLTPRTRPQTARTAKLLHLTAATMAEDLSPVTPALEEGPLTPSPAPDVVANLAGRGHLGKTPNLKTLGGQMVQLQEQVRDIAVAVGADGSSELDRLRSENAGLKACLSSAEETLAHLEDSVASMHTQHRTDLAGASQQAVELEEELAKRVAEAEEANSVASKEGKARRALEHYLSTLPSIDEVERLKKKLDESEEKRNRAETHLAELKGLLAAGERELEANAQQLATMKGQNKALQRKVDEFTLSLERMRLNDEEAALMVADVADADLRASLQARLGQVQGLTRDRQMLNQKLNRMSRSHAKEVEQLRSDLKEKDELVAQMSGQLREEQVSLHFLR